MLWHVNILKPVAKIEGGLAKGGTMLKYKDVVMD